MKVKGYTHTIQLICQNTSFYFNLFVIIGLSSHRQSPSSLSVMAAGDGTFPSLAMQPQGA